MKAYYNNKNRCLDKYTISKSYESGIILESYIDQIIENCFVLSKKIRIEKICSNKVTLDELVRKLESEIQNFIKSRESLFKYCIPIKDFNIEKAKDEDQNNLISIKLIYEGKMKYLIQFIQQSEISEVMNILIKLCNLLLKISKEKKLIKFSVLNFLVNTKDEPVIIFPPFSFYSDSFERNCPQIIKIINPPESYQCTTFEKYLSFILGIFLFYAFCSDRKSELAEFLSSNEGDGNIKLNEFINLKNKILQEANQINKSKIVDCKKDLILDCLNPEMNKRIDIKLAIQRLWKITEEMQLDKSFSLEKVCLIHLNQYYFQENILKEEKLSKVRQEIKENIRYSKISNINIFPENGVDSILKNPKKNSIIESKVQKYLNEGNCRKYNPLSLYNEEPISLYNNIKLRTNIYEKILSEKPNINRSNNLKIETAFNMHIHCKREENRNTYNLSPVESKIIAQIFQDCELNNKGDNFPDLNFYLKELKEKCYDKETFSIMKTMEYIKKEFQNNNETYKNNCTILQNKINQIEARKLNEEKKEVGNQTNLKNSITKNNFDKKIIQSNYLEDYFRNIRKQLDKDNASPNLKKAITNMFYYDFRDIDLDQKNPESKLILKYIKENSFFTTFIINEFNFTSGVYEGRSKILDSEIQIALFNHVKDQPNFNQLVLDHINIVPSLFDTFSNSLVNKTYLEILSLMKCKIGKEFQGQLFEAIKTCNNIKSLNLSENEFNIKELPLLKNALKSLNCLIKIAFNNCIIGCEGIKEILEILMEKNNLQEVYLDGNNINDEGAKTFENNFKSNFQNLQAISLSNNNISEIGIKSISNFLEDKINLKYVRLGSNKIKAGGLKILLNKLVGKQIQDLDIGNCDLLNEGAEILEKYLESVKTIKFLSVMKNSITEDRITRILQKVKKQIFPCKINIYGNNFKEENLKEFFTSDKKK